MSPRLSPSNPAAAQCVGKRAYPSFSDATTACKTRYGKDHPLHAYRCGSCGQWHVGAPRKRGKKAAISKHRIGRAPRRFFEPVEA